MAPAGSVSTHEVFNQSPLFVDINLFTSDIVLQSAVAQESGGDISNWLSEFGSVAGSARAADLARQANENPPKLKIVDANGHRADTVEFHPAWHELMGISMQHGLH
ncbi:MAG: DNA alkylation response protein, partial [Aestuariivirgaceae bacterium]